MLGTKSDDSREAFRKELDGLFSKDLSGPLRMTLAAISNFITFAKKIDGSNCDFKATNKVLTSSQAR